MLQDEDVVRLSEQEAAPPPGVDTLCNFILKFSGCPQTPACHL